MPDPLEPYVPAKAGDIIRAADWNEAQIKAREALAAHDHAQGNGQPIPREGIAKEAIDGSRIDPNAEVKLKSLELSGPLKVDTGNLVVDGTAQLRGSSGGMGLTVDSSGNVGIGMPAPRTALDTGVGAMSGAANDYQKAQFTLSGGGTVSWGGPNKYLKWSHRFIAISMERPRIFANGYIDINLPNSDSLVTSSDGTPRVDPSQGILLKDWEALYAVHEIGKDQTKVTFQIVAYNRGSFHAPSNWLLVAVVNSDDKTIKLGTGATVSQNSTYASLHGSSLPRGAIIMWTGDAAPGGWALCDGQNGTPDLRGRFILAAGAGGGLTQRNRGQTGGEEKHLLTLDEMPSHSHAITDPGHLHNWSGSRQLAGTDDNNNTSEFSKGDRSTQDTVRKDTDTRKTGITVNAAGSGIAHENMPPFYVLAYIMKL